MYGMVHQALRSMALQHMSEAEWHGMLNNSGLPQSLFIGVEYYSDDMTMGLVRTISRQLDMPLDDALNAFGRVWVDFADASHYGRILRMAGHDLVSFLGSLDRMHASIRSNMPKAEMPTFELLETGGSIMVLRYSSKRTGLAPFVKGILLAVADRFNEPVTIDYAPCDGGAVFTIRRTDQHE